MPKVTPVSASAPEPPVIAEAAAVLARGGLVAFPTETVYGLGARGLHAAEVLRIFAAKDRPAGHPLILHVTGETMARTLAASWSADAAALAAAFWPGPLTLVVPRAAHVPFEVTGGLGSVGLRAPAHPVALALIEAAGEPLAAPSANAHMHVSPTTAAHVVRSLGDRVELVLDGGPCAHGIESTVVDVTGEVPHVLRAGATSLEALRRVVPGIVHDPAGLTVTGDAPRASPGQAARHYAPRTDVRLSKDADADVGALVAAGQRVGLISWKAAAASDAGAAFVRRLSGDADGYARALFAALHEADAAGLDVLVIAEVPSDPSWWAVRDRVLRAAR